MLWYQALWTSTNVTGSNRGKLVARPPLPVPSLLGVHVGGGRPRSPTGGSLGGRTGDWEVGLDTHYVQVDSVVKNSKTPRRFDEPAPQLGAQTVPRCQLQIG
jgi:hypothetical protein